MWPTAMKEGVVVTAQPVRRPQPEKPSAARRQPPQPKRPMAPVRPKKLGAVYRGVRKQG